MTTLRCLVLGVGILFANIAPALADDDPFLGTDPVSVLAKGQKSLQQWITWNAGQTGQAYSAFESQTEFDYGATDRLQLAATLVYDWSRTRPPGTPAQYQSLPGISAEAIYIVLPTDTNLFGLAMAVDPAFNASSHAIAFRVLLEKNAWGLEHVLNINFENAWEKNPNGQWDESSGIAFNYGLGYALDEHWSVALEFGNEFAAEALLTDRPFRFQTNTFFLGPTLQIDDSFGTLTLGVQWQLPWSTGTDVHGGYTPDAERLRIGVRFAKTL